MGEVWHVGASSDGYSEGDVLQQNNWNQKALTL